MATPTSIGVLLPTRNCAAQLTRHLQAMRGWIDLAAEVVVVDSFSEDGTMEALHSGLQHPRLKLLSHPPGLYASWNHGIAALQSDFTYIATAGDSITREGLLHLAQVMARLPGDVVLSQPAFVTESGRPLRRKKWTIQRYLEALNIRQPVRIPPAHFFLTSVMFGLAGFMGSSASNLYRTETLQRFPFSTDFGHIGDTAWGLANAFFVSVSVTPRPCAQFQIHPNAGNISAAQEIAMEQELMRLARQVLDENHAAGKISAEDAPDLRKLVDDFETLRNRLHADEAACDRPRQSILPWVLNPQAWSARHDRNQRRAALTTLWRESLARFSR